MLGEELKCSLKLLYLYEYLSCTFYAYILNVSFTFQVNTAYSLFEFWGLLQILGIVENMSYFKCPHCGEPSFIFGKRGAQKTAEDMGLRFVGEVCFISNFSGSPAYITLLSFRD